MTAKLREALDRYPRVTLTRQPTPLHRLPTLSDRTGLEIYIKRDDLTDLTFGGDKPRKLEYEIAAALEAGADTLITLGSSQSNHARLTAAAARRVGMDCVVVLSNDQWSVFQGNLLATYLMGATVEIAETDDHWAMDQHVARLAQDLEARGKRPHVVPISGTTALSCLGYVRAGLEIADQLSDMNVRVGVVYTVFGTGGIYAPVMLALRESGLSPTFVGISVNRDVDQCQAYLDRWWEAMCGLLDLDPQRSRGSHEMTDRHVGAGYGDPTEAALDAILRLGESEGILLDPVYTGKMAAGFFADVDAGRWEPGTAILLIHSGGTPALFAYHRPLQAHLQRRGRLG